MWLNKQNHRKKFFFGWWTVLSTGILSGLGWGIFHQGVTIFFKPIAADLQLNRTRVSLVSGMTKMEGSVTAPFAGWLVDKFGPKWLMFGGVCLMGIGLILMFFVNSLWSYILVWTVIITIGIDISLQVTVDKSLSDWFIRKRGLAMGIKFTMLSAGSLVVLPLLAWLVEIYEWRIACVMCGVAMLLASPLILFFVKQYPPEYYGLFPDGASLETVTPDIDKNEVSTTGVSGTSVYQEREFTLKQAMKTQTFWLLAGTQMCVSLLTASLSVHIVPFLTDLHIDLVVASSMWALQYLFMTPFRFVGGIVSDRIKHNHQPYILAIAYLIMGLSFVPFLLHQTIPLLYIFIIFHGIGNGIPTVLRISIIAHSFGRKAFGKIFGATNFFTGMVGFLAPIYAGWMFDRTNSYITVFTQGVILAIVAGILAFFIKIPKPLEQNRYI